MKEMAHETEAKVSSVGQVREQQHTQMRAHTYLGLQLVHVHHAIRILIVSLRGEGRFSDHFTHHP